MKSLKNIIASIVLTPTALFAITGCNDDALTNNSATISYINALDKQATFYVKESSDSSSVYLNKHKVTTLIQGDYSDELRHKWFSIQESRFAVEDTNSRDEQMSIEYRLKDDRDYWSVAWLNNDEYNLSLFKRVSSDRDGLYRVRIFANDKLDVYLGENTTKLLTTETGQVSDFISLDKCTDLVIEGNAIDLCSGDFGHSYLLVVNANGLIAMAEEHK